jgi:hypothetical protein
VGQYGQAALAAVKLLKNGKAIDAPEAWGKATTAQFGKGTPAQQKSCPRGAFLGCCEDGLVRGVPHGSYTTSRENKRYAVTAVRLLKTNPRYASISEKDLWLKVLKKLKLPINKAHNNQMDIVVTMYRNGLIR